MILIPLGVSYYTFSTVSYLLDVYWKRYAYEKNFARFLLYTSYFPHIIQGPISRYNKLGAELKKDLVVSNKQIIFGLELIIWGFFKKLVWPTGSMFLCRRSLEVRCRPEVYISWLS